MANLSDKEVAECKEVFGVFDMRNEGKICALKVADMLRAMKLKPTNKAVDKLLGIDPDKKLKANEKTVTLEEFMPIYKEVTKIKDTGAMEDFMEAMKVYDKEQNGTIIAAELRHLLLALGERLTDQQVDEIMQKCGNEDSEGYTKYEDFIKKVLEGPFPEEDNQ